MSSNKLQSESTFSGVKKIINSLFYLFFTLFLVLPLQVNAASVDIIWQGGIDYVGLEPVDIKNTSNDHPVKISQQEIFEYLGSIQLTDPDKNLISLDFLDFFSNDTDEFTESRLFNRGELVKLSKHVATAFSKAGKNQDVVFSITSSHEKMLGKGSLSTSGRLFFSEGKLNMIIGELRVDIERKYRMRGGYSDVPEKIDYHKLKNFRLDTGSRKSESDLDYTFVTDDSHQLKANKNKVREDWLLINVALLRNEITQHKEKERRKDNIVDETVDLKQQTNQIDVEQEQLKRKVDRLERVLEAREKSERTSQAGNADTVSSERSVEQRLTELKALNDKGIISEEIYKQKMKEILEDL